MRSALSIACLFVMLAAATPAQAQLRGGDDARRSPVRVFGSNEAMAALNTLFSPAHFRMSHSYEFSTSSFAGGSSLGMYTNTMMWQFNQKLAARVDVSYAHTPFGGNQFGMDNGGRVFLRNAEIAYRPTDRLELHFSVRQSPFGSYMGPYGYYSPFYGYGHGLGYGFNRGDDLFWNTPQR